MRVFVLALCTSMLAACSGAGPQSIGNISTPTAPNATATHSFVSPTEQKVYNAIGGSQTFKYDVTQDNVLGTTSGQANQLYQGNASTVRSTGITVDYNPRDAIFDIVIRDPLSGVSTRNRFQDPIHRTDFGGAREPQTGIPNSTLPGMQYLQSGTTTATISLIPGTIAPLLAAVPLDASLTDKDINKLLSGEYNATSYFYQKPGTTTKFVTFSGFLRNNVSLKREVVINTDPITLKRTVASDSATTAYTLERGAFVFGENTASQNVPKLGTASFSGTMLATMVFNDQIDVLGLRAPTYFQWIEGTSDTKVNFAANTFTLTLAGSTFGAQFDRATGNLASIADGARFNANGSGRIDLIKASGFVGQFQQAWFVNPNGTRLDVNVGGSSIDGSFFGPVGQEIGGGFRIVGGTPDERVDLLGVFVGK